MASYQPVPASGSNGTYVKGNLGFIDPFEAFLDHIDQVIDDAVNGVLDDLRTDARQRAQTDPDWGRFSDILDVSFDGEEFQYGFTPDAPDDEVQDALELEYGSPSAPARPFLRTLARKQAPLVGDQISRLLSQEVPLG
jgi:hypothetical protein